MAGNSNSGRRPLPPGDRLISRRDRDRIRAKVQPVPGKPEPPSDLTIKEKAEFNRVCDLLDAMGLLTKDLTSNLLGYIAAWSRVRELRRLIACVESGKPVPSCYQKTPVIALGRALGSANRDMLAALASLGLTTRSKQIINRHPTPRDTGDVPDEGNALATFLKVSG